MAHWPVHKTACKAVQAAAVAATAAAAAAAPAPRASSAPGAPPLSAMYVKLDAKTRKSLKVRCASVGAGRCVAVWGEVERGGRHPPPHPNPCPAPGKGTCPLLS